MDQQRKDITTLLTDAEASEILEYVYPNKGYWTTKVVHSVQPEPDGSYQITFGGRLPIGIHYHNGQDNCILHFDSLKVIHWLYGHGYEIEDLIKENFYLETMESRLDRISFEIYQLSLDRKSVV